MERYLGESIPKLGFGLMRLPRKGEEIDIAQVKQMVDLFLNAGFCYFDTSWGYPGSEDAIRTALCQRYPREKYLLATKCPVWRAKTREEARGMLDTSLKRTGAGYFDFYLLHNMGEHRTKVFDDYDMWNLVREQKEKGLIRHIGFSFHDTAEALDELLTRHPEAEFVQLQINYADWESPSIQSRKCYEVARSHGKPVIIMEPVKGGTLASLPDKAAGILKEANPAASLPSWAIRYAASLDGLVTVLSGMSSMEQMKDNISYMRDFKTLTEEERAVIDRVQRVLEEYCPIPCTSCHYCTEVCPQKVAIPGIFEAANIYQMYGTLPFARFRYEWNTDYHHLARATACVRCGKCEQACPQHIKIRDELQKAAAVLE